MVVTTYLASHPFWPWGPRPSDAQALRMGVPKKHLDEVYGILSIQYFSLSLLIHSSNEFRLIIFSSLVYALSSSPRLPSWLLSLHRSRLRQEDRSPAPPCARASSRNNDLVPERSETVFKAFCLALSSCKSSFNTTFCDYKSINIHQKTWFRFLTKLFR